MLTALSQRRAMVWARTPGGEIVAPLQDYVGRSAFLFGDMDRKLTAICRRLVRPGDTVLDIGANLGLVTLLLSRLVGPRGRVLAFEPNPRLVDLVELALSRARAENVRIFPVALGDAQAELELRVPMGNFGMGSLTRAPSAPEVNRYRVPVETLSRVLSRERCGPIRLVKIDVEGFEPQVLAGAHDAFQRQPPDAIVFELNDPGATSDHPTLVALDALGYRFLAIPRSLLRLRLRPWRLSEDLPASHDFVAVHAGAGEAWAALAR
jgi:FkbM family methyltransferase